MKTPTSADENHKPLEPLEPHIPHQSLLYTTIFRERLKLILIIHIIQIVYSKKYGWFFLFDELSFPADVGVPPIIKGSGNDVRLEGLGSWEYIKQT